MKGTVQSSPSSGNSPVGDSALGSMLQQLRVRKRMPGGMIIANFNNAMEAVWANRMRAMLTGLGIFIGVASVVTILVITTGIGESINQQIVSQGANSITITRGAPGGNSTGVQTSRPLTVKDVNSLATLEHIAGISPVVGVGSVQVVYGNNDWSTSVSGVSPDFLTMQNWEIANGAWFTEADNDGGKAFAVIGSTIAAELFEETATEPIGKSIRIRDQIFTVIGVLKSKGSSFGQDQDSTVLIPYRSALARLNNSTEVDMIQVQVASSDRIEQVQQAISATLKQNHRIPPDGTEDFRMFTSQQILEQAAVITGVFTSLFVGIAAISLTVGGIGIMNIMLVSVTERTREIGIRIALGARRSDIRNQFLIEALTLCLISGLVGLTLGILLGILLLNVISASAGAELPLVITPNTLLMPFLVSGTIGVVFGLYPAVRAARLDPIEALRADD